MCLHAFPFTDINTLFTVFMNNCSYPDTRLYHADPAENQTIFIETWEKKSDQAWRKASGCTNISGYIETEDSI
jgi:hypothetical protein